MHGYWTIFGRCVNVNEALYLGTFTRAGGVLLGASMAMWWRPVAILRGPLRDKPHRLDLLALIGLAGLGALTFRLFLSEDGSQLGLHYDPYLFRGGFFLTGLATLAIIAAVTHRRSWTGKVLGNPLLLWIGVRSYGLYLFHWLVFQVIRKEAGIELTFRQFALAMVVTVLIAELSYRLVEMPVRSGRLGEWLRGERVARTRRVYNRRRCDGGHRRRRRRLSPGSPASASPPPTTSASARSTCSLQYAGGTAPPPASVAPAPTTSTTGLRRRRCRRPPRRRIPCRARPRRPAAGARSVGHRAVDDGRRRRGDDDRLPRRRRPSAPTTTRRRPPRGPGTDDPAADVTGTSVLTQQAGPAPLAIGESVMQGATNQLAAGGFNVDAQQSRQGTDIAALIEAHRAAGEIGSIVVLQVGTNGSVSDATYDRIMATLPADQTPYVFFLTVRAPRAGSTPTTRGSTPCRAATRTSTSSTGTTSRRRTT